MLIFSIVWMVCFAHKYFGILFSVGSKMWIAFTQDLDTPPYEYLHTIQYPNKLLLKEVGIMNEKMVKRGKYKLAWQTSNRPNLSLEDKSYKQGRDWDFDMSTLAFLTVRLRLLKFGFGLCEDRHYVNYRPVESIYCWDTFAFQSKYHKMLISKGLHGDQLSIFLENLHYKSKHIFDSRVRLLKKKAEYAQNLISIFHLVKKNR